MSCHRALARRVPVPADTQTPSHAFAARSTEYWTSLSMPPPATARRRVSRHSRPAFSGQRLLPCSLLCDRANKTLIGFREFRGSLTSAGVRLYLRALSEPSACGTLSATGRLTLQQHLINTLHLRCGAGHAAKGLSCHGVARPHLPLGKPFFARGSLRRIRGGSVWSAGGTCRTTSLAIRTSESWRWRSRCSSSDRPAPPRHFC